MAADMPGPQTQQNSTAATYTQQLLELQQLLHVQQSSKRSPTDIAAADTAVTQLRQATAALQKLHQTPQQHLGNARQKSSVIISVAQACAAAAACMQALAQLLRSPPAELYCEPSGSPCQPPEGLELAGGLKTCLKMQCDAEYVALWPLGASSPHHKAGIGTMGLCSSGVFTLDGF